MTRMVQAAVAGDVAEAEEIRAILSDVGIESELQAESDDDPLTVLVPEAKLDEAQDAIELATEPDELAGEP
jgi:hypothetical protein